MLHPPEDYTRWIIRNGRTGHPDFIVGMTAYDECALSDTTLDEIIAFLNAPPKPTDGQGLYEDFCANCHGDDGRGGLITTGFQGEDPHAPILRKNRPSREASPRACKLLQRREKTKLTRDRRGNLRYNSPC